VSAPEPYWSSEDGDVVLYLGDCLDVLRTLEADSVDAIVTDPPAGIAFMDREWDDFRRARNPADAGRDNVFGRTSARGPEYGRRDRGQFVDWLTERMSEALRVLKPGGHLLVWSIPRTSHWTAWALEDAGLEIRDCILHLFGSGFPKSLDVSKAIDRAAVAVSLWDEIRAHIREWRDRNGMTNNDLNAALGLRTTGSGMAAHWTRTGPNQQAIPSKEMWQRLKRLLNWPDCALDAIYDAVKDGADRPVVGQRTTGIGTGRGAVAVIGDSENRDITTPATPDAARWEGWGTALKPGQEMWWLARKPLKGTVAACVLEFGTGALNVAACKVGTDPITQHGRSDSENTSMSGRNYAEPAGRAWEGRWPANVVFTHSAACDGRCAPDCPAGELDRQSGVTKSSGGINGGKLGVRVYGAFENQVIGQNAGGLGDTGGASRFYPVFRYQAKAPASERPRLEDGTAHETVKPLGLMSWLVRLITPPGGTVLDLFAGSGPVGEACIIEGFRCVLIEQDPKSARLIVKRLSKPIQPAMFGLEDAGLPGQHKNAPRCP
jgi:hypothetical protein